MRRVVFGMSVIVALSACSDPLRNVARLGDVSVSDGAATVAQTPAEARNTGGGLFGRLLNRAPDDPTNAAVEAALADAGVADPQAATQAAPELEEATAVGTPQVDPAPQPRRGLFGLFGGNRLQTPSTSAPEAPVMQSTPGAQDAQPLVDDTPRLGLAGLFRRDTPGAGIVTRSGPDAGEVAAGTVMPFGQVARVCGLSRRDLGTRIENASGFAVYDTIPNSTARRPFYITGFNDNCARTFTGAVVITGDIETHEFVRYQSSNERIAYTETDNAYEALKASACRVGRGQPCGARSAQLNRNTQFITVYDFFGGTFSAVPTEWAQILVHDGQMLAMSVKN